MASGTPQEMLPIFREYFPEFSHVSDDKVLLYLRLASQIFCLCQDATLYLAAHLLSTAQYAGIGGFTGGSGTSLPYQQTKVGSKQVQYFQSAKNSDDLQYTTTQYGMMYLQLRRACQDYTTRALRVCGVC